MRASQAIFLRKSLPLSSENYFFGMKGTISFVIAFPHFGHFPSFVEDV